MWYDLKKQQQKYFYLYSVLIYHSTACIDTSFISLLIATKNSEFYKWNESTSYRGQVNFKEFI